MSFSAGIVKKWAWTECWSSCQVWFAWAELIGSSVIAIPPSFTATVVSEWSLSQAPLSEVIGNGPDSWLMGGFAAGLHSLHAFLSLCLMLSPSFMPLLLRTCFSMVFFPHLRVMAISVFLWSQQSNLSLFPLTLFVISLRFNYSVISFPFLSKSSKKWIALMVRDIWSVKQWHQFWFIHHHISKHIKK